VKIENGLFHTDRFSAEETDMKKSALTVLVAIIPAALSAAPYYHEPFFFHEGGFIMWIITLALAGLLIYFIYKETAGRKIGIESSGSPDALSILKVRLAKGEISEEEYDRLKARIAG